MKGITFNKFIQQIKKHVLEFKPGETFDADKWNDEYVHFKTQIRKYKPEYLKRKTGNQLIIEWARHWFGLATWDTHSYRVIKKENGWYCANTTKPEKCRGVIVLIPGEDNHITSAMWDISEKWVILDGYRKPEEKVTHWRPLPDLPKSIKNDIL